MACADRTGPGPGFPRRSSRSALPRAHDSIAYTSCARERWKTPPPGQVGGGITFASPRRPDAPARPALVSRGQGMPADLRSSGLRRPACETRMRFGSSCCGECRMCNSRGAVEHRETGGFNLRHSACWSRSWCMTVIGFESAFHGTQSIPESGAPARHQRGDLSGEKITGVAHQVLSALPESIATARRRFRARAAISR